MASESVAIHEHLESHWLCVMVPTGRRVPTSNPIQKGTGKIQNDYVQWDGNHIKICMFVESNK